MPHSSSGFGEVKVGRVYLVEKENAKESSDGKLNLEGQESSPPTTVAMVAWLHDQVSGFEEGKLVPVTFRDKAERDGYYTINSATSSLTDHQSEVSLMDWTLELQRQGSDSEIDIQSRLTGAVRLNDFSLSGTRWHAPAIGHTGYYTGSTAASSHTRTTEDGTITVYTSVPANVHPKWACPVASYHTGRVRLTSTTYVSSENEVEGINRRVGVTGWTLSNGLIRITPSGTNGRLTIGIWSSGSYRTRDWNVQVGGSNVGAWDTLTILRNDPELVAIRLVATRSGGRDSLDLTLRRGAQFVECYLQTHTSATLGVVQNTAQTSDNAVNGTVAATASDANGIRGVCGSSKTFTANTVNGGLSKTSQTALDFWVGYTIGAGTGSQTDRTALRDQYIASMPEMTYAVRR